VRSCALKMEFLEKSVVFQVWIRASLIGLCLGFSATAQASFELVSRVDGAPLPANAPNGEILSPSISSNGRFVAFTSNANNLVADDPNGPSSNSFVYDIFVYDRDTDAIELLTPGGNLNSSQPSISADGRFVAFASEASNLVAGDSSDPLSDIFLYDRTTDTTQKVTVGGNDDSRSPTISGDGRFIAFESRAGNLVAGDTNGSFDIFVYDTLTDTTELLAPGGGLLDGSRAPSISADGRFVAFTSAADNLAPGDTNGSIFDIFVFDRDTDTVELITAGGNSDSFRPSISADGRIVVFDSRATNFASGDTNGGNNDVFAYDRDTGTFELLTAGGNNASFQPTVSADGQVVAFRSSADNLLPGADSSGLLVYNRDTDVVELISTPPEVIGLTGLPSLSVDGQLVVFLAIDSNSQTNAFVSNRGTDSVIRLISANLLFEAVAGTRDSTSSSVSATGRFVAFESDASNLVAGDTNNRSDIFVRDRETQRTQILTLGANGDSGNPSISADGRFVTFQSVASNIEGAIPLVTPPFAVSDNIYVYDRDNDTTELVTTGTVNSSFSPTISADGRFVAFESRDPNLVSSDTNGTRPDIFVYDRQTSTTELITAGGNSDSFPSSLLSGSPSLSADGQFVAFHSSASNITSGDSNGTVFDIFVYDRTADILQRLTVGANGFSVRPSISDDGRFVAFESRASNLVANDVNGLTDVFVYDRQTATTQRLSAGANTQGRGPSISGDGGLVAFIANDALVVFDRVANTFELLAENALFNTFQGTRPSISADGQVISFTSEATDLSSEGVFVDNTNVFVSVDNVAPTADALSAATNEDVAVAVTLTGFDSDGDALSFQTATLPSNGVLSGTAPNFVYTPNADFFGADSFMFTSNDGSATSDPATVTISVVAVNDAPVALGTDTGATSLSTPEDTALAITLFGSDVEGDGLTYAVTAQPVSGTLSGTAPNLTYIPAINFNGTDQFSFTVSDGALTSAPATISLTVSSTDDAPSGSPQSLVTAANTPVSITLTGTDPDSASLSFSIFNLPANGTLSGDLPNVTYTPGNDFTGSDSFSFTVSDGVTTSPPATVSISVTEGVPPPVVNNAPVANAQSLSVAQDASVSILLTGSDADGDTLSFNFAALPANGSVSGTPPNLTYVPGSNFVGVDSFTFTVSDGTVTSSQATVTITVTEVVPPPEANSAPVANAQSVSVPQNTSVSILLTGSDADGDSLSFDFVALPANGSLSGAPPNLVYTPDANFMGPDSFSFTVSDAEDTSAVATVSISVVEGTVTLFSAVLPSSRSVEVGTTATAFATLINAGSLNAQDCAVRLPEGFPASFFYQASDSTTNEVIGQPNQVVDIPAGASQSFVFGITPTEAFSATQVALEFQCANAADAASFGGLNTLLLSASVAPVPDLIALVATLSQNGVMELSGNSGFFTSASINVGSAAMITVSADTGAATLPLALSLCQTDPVTSACINPTVPSTDPVIVEIAEGGTPTFAVFASASDPIALDPANSRVFLYFSDELGEVRGATSVAVANE